MSQGGLGSSEAAAAERPEAALPLVRPQPRTVIIAAAVVVALAWLVFLVVDVWNVGGLGDRFNWPLWTSLFNDRPVEWLQWVALAAAIVAGAYLAGRLHGRGDPALVSFLGLMAVGAAIMLLEEAGDIRHVVSSYVQIVFGQEPILGIHYRVLSDVPYFAVIAAVPVYALLRHGLAVWRQAPNARSYLVVAYGLYGLSAASSGLRHLGGGDADQGVDGGGLYESIGRFLHELFLSGAAPPPGESMEWLHFFIVDSIVEESVELLAAASLLALLLAVGIAAVRTAQAGQAVEEE